MSNCTLRAGEFFKIPTCSIRRPKHSSFIGGRLLGPGNNICNRIYAKRQVPRAGRISDRVLQKIFRPLSLKTLPLTMRQAVISVILKKGKNPLECNSFHPISLLNTDAKILAKVLARRLEGVLPSIISPDQTGFIKNRYSFFNVRRLFNILYSPSPPGVPEVVLPLDAEKAFDRVEWGYLFSTLERFGFGKKFTSWIRLIYTSPVAAVRTNNNLSPFFELKRGTRQGCPMSPLLFVVAMEPLALALRL